MMRSGRFKLRVAVVGCGIAGPAAALLLSRQGHEVTIFERAAEIKPKGAGILLSPTGQFVLEELGLLQEVALGGSRIGRIIGRNPSGREVIDVRYSRVGTGLAGIGISRTSLFSILHRALNSSDVELRLGREIVGLTQSHLRSEDGESFGPFDLILVSDGARSRLRSELGFVKNPKPYPYGAIWTSATNWGEFADNVLQQAFAGTRRMAGLLPSGKSPDGQGKLISIFWSIKLSQWDRLQGAGVSAWSREVSELFPGSEAFVAQIGDDSSLTVAHYYDSRAIPPFKGRFVLLGDAAHAMSPQLGQGASLALMDAWILADSLEREQQVDAGLISYGERRRRHVNFYAWASRAMTPLFQSDHSWLAAPRDMLMGPLCRVPWLSKQIALTMCGAKAGVFRSIRQEEEVMSLAARSALRLSQSSR